MQRSRRWHPAAESDELVYAVCAKFLQQFQAGEQAEQNDTQQRKKRRRGKTIQRGGATAIAKWLREERGRPDITRERIYPLLSEGVRRGFLMLRPPLEIDLAEQLIRAFGINAPGERRREIHVVNVRETDSMRHVTATAADLVLDLIHRVWQERRRNRREEQKQGGEQAASKPAVHLGLGGGLAGSLLAKRLARRVYSDRGCPPLVLHALSAGGFASEQPERSPITFVSYFDGALPDISAVALFSETIVTNDEFDRVCNNPTVRRAMEQAGDIDIVITSFASANDEHGLLQKYLGCLVAEGSLPPDTLERLHNAGWIGDVQFRPYSEQGPIKSECPVRAVTLFELEDLVSIANDPDRYVVLLASPCAVCGRLKTDALYPLIANPNLRVWSHLVLDADTAVSLLSLHEQRTGGASKGEPAV